MDYQCEATNTCGYSPVKVFIHSVNRLKMHFHRELEIILVLKGSIYVRIGPDRYLLKENDFILINSGEIHNTKNTGEDNICLALQIDIDHVEKYYPSFSKKIFKCRSFLYEKDKQKELDVIRGYLAKIVWDMNKDMEGNRFKIGSDVLLILDYIVKNCDYSILEENLEDIYKNVNRMNSILKFIDDNLDNGVSLKDVADNESLSIYYVSRFIKKYLGITFQEYINLKRLDKAVFLLRHTNKSITEIALESGFPSIKSHNNMFNKAFGISPTEFRKRNFAQENLLNDLEADITKIKSKTYLDVDRDTAFSKLFSYLDLIKDQVEDRREKIKPRKSINANITKEGRYHNYYWKNLTTFGRAAEGIRKQWQTQLEEVQRDLDFKYIRFHGIFSDEMMVFNYDNDGNIVYNWSYVNELFDFFKKVNIKPFVELGFMPSEIKSSNETMFWWKANISQPKDISLWTDMVKEFIRNCINRYGLEEVESWYFEVWNEPELEYVYWIGGKEDYFKFYKETALAIKSISDKIKVGGPSITHQALKDSTWLQEFLIYCNDAPLDFVTLHIYPESYSSAETEGLIARIMEGEDILDLAREAKQLKPIYFGKDHTYDTLKSARDFIKDNSNKELELHVTEWSASAIPRNLISDTAYVGTFIIRNVLNSIGQVDSLGYWTFTDIMEEMKAGISHFHGGFGLINKEGLKKPSYNAYYLLSKLGPEIIEQGEDFIITKKGEDIQVLIYNFAYFDELFTRGDISLLTMKERYLIYEQKDPMEVQLNLEGLRGRYKITKYELNREHGSVFDEWVRMGMPENMTEEEIGYLKGKSSPKMTVEYAEIDENYITDLYIPVHGLVLITLNKQI